RVVADRAYCRVVRAVRACAVIRGAQGGDARSEIRYLLAAAVELRFLVQDARVVLFGQGLGGRVRVHRQVLVARAARHQAQCDQSVEDGLQSARRDTSGGGEFAQ